MEPKAFYVTFFYQKNKNLMDPASQDMAGFTSTVINQRDDKPFHAPIMAAQIKKNLGVDEVAIISVFDIPLSDAEKSAFLKDFEERDRKKMEAVKSGPQAS